MKKRITFILTLFTIAVMCFTVPAFAGSSATAAANASAAGGTASSSATGGNASSSATGGNATGGNAAVGDIGNTSGNSQTVNIAAPVQKDITTTRNEGHGYRGYANPAEVHYPGTPGYFGNATRGASFEDAKTILKYKKSFGTDELKKMAKSGFGSKVIVTPLVDKVAKDKRADVISIYITDPTPKPELLGYVTAKATGNNVVSMDILAEAALAARELGGNAIQVSGEGVERSLQSFGWGIGLAYTGAHINNDETSSSVAAGGTGIAGGSAGYHDRPWVQIFILNVK